MCIEEKKNTRRKLNVAANADVERDAEINLSKERTHGLH